MKRLWLIWAALVVIGVGVIQLWYWLLWPQTPLILKRPIEVIQLQQFGANNTLVYAMDYCKPDKYSNLAAEVHYTLLNHDGIVHELPGMAMGTVPVGCQTIKIAVPIPLLRPGTYSLRMARVYQVNPVRRLSIDSESGTFEIPVAPAPEQAPTVTEKGNR